MIQKNVMAKFHDIPGDVCTTCLRVSWENWLKECDSNNVPRKVALFAKQILEKIYEGDCTKFSGLRISTIKAVMIYIAQFFASTDFLKSQKEIAAIFGCSDSSIRKYYKTFYKYYLSLI